MKQALKIIGIIVGSIVGVFVLLAFVLPALFGGTPENISVSIQQPELIHSNESFDITYTITNTSDRAKELDSIDIEKDFLEEIVLVDISEPTTDRYSAFGMRSYEFLKDIALGESLDVSFTFKGQEGIYFSVTDICIDGPGGCLSRDLSFFIE